MTPGGTPPWGKRAAVGILALSVTAALASEMIFRLNLQLRAASPGISKTGRHTLALPYRPTPGLVMASDLMRDIGFEKVYSVERYLAATDGYQTYTGRKGSPGADFPLVPGEGVMVRVGSDATYRAVGGHDGARAIPLLATGAGSKSGRNFLAPPFASTAGTAKDLMDDIGFGAVSDVSRYLTATDSFQTYTGRKGSPGANFSIVPGEAYFVRMSSTVQYVPSHY